jgi:hypothetical protein
VSEPQDPGRLLVIHRAPDGLLESVLERAEDPGLDLRVHSAPPDLLERAMARADQPERRSGGLRVVAIAASFLLGIGIGFALRPSAPQVPTQVAQTAEVGQVDPASEPVPVRLVLHAPEAGQVQVAGSFNGWDPQSARLERGRDGTFQATLLLPRGQHEYMFVVDGDWRPDPAAPILRDDGFGNMNAVLEI